jgi:hypothetical protein
LKRFTLDRILAEAIRQNGGPAPLNEQSDSKSVDEWVRIAGAKCASWLVWQHRQSLHKNGGIAFFLSGTLKKGPPLTPPWMRIALEKLKRNDKTWQVDMSITPGRRTYVLKWLRWGTFMRPGDSAVS